MGRIQFIEIHDQSWCPRVLRDGCTDYLAFAGNLSAAPYRPYVERLVAAIRATGERRFLDLCSGGSGPTPQFIKLLRDEHGIAFRATATDLFPNLEKFASLTREGIDAHPDPVDATDVPTTLRGFRTINNAFHHFPPDLARGILADAIRKRNGIAILEVVSRHPASMLPLVLFAPLLVTLTTPFVRPFRWSRLLLTYLIPAIPFVIWFDGIISCLRVYSPDELHSIIENIDGHEEFTWEFGKLAMGATYCIGYPKQSLPLH